MKEMMRVSDELRLSRDEAVAAAKESEKKIKAMEADTFHLQEVLKMGVWTHLRHYQLSR